MLNSQNDLMNNAEINLMLLLQNMVEGVILQNKDGEIIQINQAALDILGMTNARINQRPDSETQDLNLAEWDKVFPGKKHPGMTSLKSGEIQKSLVQRVFRNDGELRWISLNSVPIFDENKNPTHLISTFTDVTEMRRLLNELKQVQLLFNISHDLMIITNKEGYFKKINPRFVDVLNYNFEEVSNQNFLNLIHPEDIDSTKAEMNKLNNQREAIHFINRYKSKNNIYRVFDWIVVPDSDTNLIYFTARDITDYKAEELELLHSSKVYSIGELTSSIAYLLTSQLSIIEGHISYLQSQMVNGEIKIDILKYKIEAIHEATTKIAKTTKDLSNFARYVENERITNISLSRILENITDLCKERFRIHGVHLKIILGDNLFIKSRESQIVHAILNLLNIHYNLVHSERESWVELVGSADNGLVHIIISCSGLRDQELKQKFSIPKKLIEENFGSFHIDQSSSGNRLIIEFPQVLRDQL